MKVEVQNSKLVSVLKDREEIFTEVVKRNAELERISKERQKLGYKLDKLKEKTKVIMDKLNPVLGEFEIITRVFLEDGKAYYEIEDMVELYKEELRKKNADTTDQQ